jgi:hypothetical protein
VSFIVPLARLLLPCNICGRMAVDCKREFGDRGTGPGTIVRPKKTYSLTFLKFSIPVGVSV